MAAVVDSEKKLQTLLKNRNKAIVAHTKKIFSYIQPALDGIQTYLEKYDDLKKHEKLIWSQIIPVTSDMFFLLGVVLSQDDNKEEVELPVRVAVPMDILLNKDPAVILKFLEEQEALEEKAIETNLGELFSGIPQPTKIDKKKLN